MKLELTRHGIVITPENEQDQSYLQDTLGITANGTAETIIGHQHNIAGQEAAYNVTHLTVRGTK